MAKCTECGHEVTCLYHDAGGDSQIIDLYFYVCAHCGHKDSDTQNMGQMAGGNDEITLCPFCSGSCIKHRQATKEDLRKFREKTPPQS